MIHKVLPWLVGTAWGSLIFMLGLQLFFPSGAAVERLQYEIDKASDGVWQLSADSAGMWRATGLKLKGVELFKVDDKPTLERADDEEGDEGPTATRFVVADHIAVRAQVLALLSGAKQASFDADLYRGDLSGSIGLRGEALGTAGEADALDLSLIPFEGDTLSLDLAGELSATWDLVIDIEDSTESTGEIKLEVDDLELLSASVAGFDLEETSSFSKAELVIEVEDGKAKIKEGALVGDLIEAKIDGEVTLSKKFDRSRLRLKVEFTLAEHIDNLVKLLPGAKDARRDDGRYHYSVTGTILHPSFRAEKERRSSSRTRRVTEPDEGEPAILPGGLGGGDEEDIDADERRRLREERIRERRERLRERREASQDKRDAEDDDVGGRDDDEFADDDEFLDDEHADFVDEMPLPLGNDYDDVEINEVPYDDEELEDFEDEF